MKADDLFAGNAPPALPPDPVPGIQRMLMIALPMTFFGPLVCVTSVPGALLTLWVWYRADEELARVESGALPGQWDARVRTLRRQAFAALSAASMLMMLQLALLSLGVYQGLIGLALSVYDGLSGGGGPPIP